MSRSLPLPLSSSPTPSPPRYNSLLDITWNFNNSLLNDIREADTLQSSEKSETEIQSYIIDDSKSELEKYQNFILGGQSIQRYASIDNLIRLCQLYGIDECSKLFIDIQHTLPILDYDIQAHAAHIYQTLICNKA